MWGRDGHEYSLGKKHSGWKLFMARSQKMEEERQKELKGRKRD